MIMGTQARIKSLPFEELWQKFTGKIPKEDSEFISDGGDSFSAILFAESIKSNNSEILEILLTKKYKDLKELPVKTDINSTHTVKVNKSIKTSKFEPAREKLWRIKWKQNLGKCIDSSPLILEPVGLDRDTKVIIGSHKGILGCFNGNSSEELWKIQLDDRIEATAISNGKNVFVGTYSGSFYCIQKSNGEIIFKNNDSSDILKGRALVYKTSVIFGSHDGWIRSISVESGILKWSTSVNSPIVAPLLTFDSNNLICVTLRGLCFKINSENGQIIWTVTLDSPIFSTPICKNGVLIIATVKGYIYKVLENENDKPITVWKVTIKENIFSPLTYFCEKIICNTQEGLTMCMDLSSGEILWKFNSKNPIISGSCVVNNELFVIDKKSIVTKFSSFGEVLYQEDLNIAETFSTPVVFNNLFYIGSRDDHFYCFQIGGIHKPRGQ